MKTDELIRALAADAPSAEAPIGRTVAIGALIGTAIALAIFMATLGLRPDFAEVATGSARFVFKFVVTLGVAVPAFLLVRELSRPDFEPRRRLWWLALAPVLLLCAIGGELASVPADAWLGRMIGHNSFYCMTIIPALALAPFAALLYALHKGAPAYPVATGAIGGLLSAAIGATLYATHCTDDSPLFVGLWYPFGFILMTLLGALVGWRALRW